MLAGLPVLVAMAGVETTFARRQLEAARLAFEVAGFSVETELTPGEPEDVLPPLVKALGAALLVMGPMDTRASAS